MASKGLRAAIVLLFAVTTGLWVWSGYAFHRRISELEAATDAVNQRYNRAQVLLSNVRSDLMLASVLARDALLDEDVQEPAAVRAYIKKVEDTCQRAHGSLNAYEPVLSSNDERSNLGVLRRELDVFHRTMMTIVSRDTPDWRDAARAQLRVSTVGSQPDTVLRVADEFQTLNRAAFVGERARIAAGYASAVNTAWMRFGVSLFVGLAVGVLAIVHAGRLERRIKRQAARDRALTSDLQRLSARLSTVQEDERRTIARELHDEVGQALAAIRMDLGAAQRLPDDRAGVAAMLAGARRLAEETQQNIRNLSHLLHPSHLDDLGLGPALKAHAAAFAQRHGVACDVRVDDGDLQLPADIRTALYRITQEALANVARHAHARACQVLLVRRRNRIVLTITDDGAGFEPAARGSGTGSDGLGLVGMRERAARLNGQFSVDSAPGHGTRLTVEVPV